MFSVNNLLAILAGFIVLFFGGYLFYGVLAAGFYDDHLGSATGINKEEVNLTFIALGCLIQAVVLTLLYSKWVNGKHSVSNGLQFGSSIGLIIGFGIGLIMYGTSNFLDLTAHIIDGFFNIIFYALTGLAIAFVLKKTQVKDLKQ